MTTEFPPTTVELRRWAELKGLPVQFKGMLPRGLIVAWDRAHPDRPYVKSQAHHGTVAGYQQWGCKCERCTEAVMLLDRDRRDNRREDSQWQDDGALA